MKTQTSISTTDRLFIGCQFTQLIGEAPHAITTCGTAMAFDSEFGQALINFDEKRLTIDEFTWEEEMIDALLEFTNKHEFDLVLQLPDGAYSIFRYALQHETI